MPAVLLSSAAMCHGQPVPDDAPYRDAARSVEERVGDLLGRMTTEEKCAQLRCAWELDKIADADGRFDAGKAAALMPEGLGGFGPVRLDIPVEVAFRNEAQAFARNHTRLGIPLLFHEEGCHGVLAPQATSFPAPIGLACSWNEELIESVFQAVAAEMSARGARHALTPIADVCRDPRWGRSDETTGEDPFLVGRLATAMVRGLQGRDAETIGPQHVAATLKHLVGHGAPEAGVNRAPAHVGPRELRALHLEPFRMVLAAASPAAVMPSYNEIDGIPSHANRWLLQDLLRVEYGYTGLVTSDYWGVRDLVPFHRLAADDASAALLAFNSGVDMDLPDGNAFSHLPALVSSGKINSGRLDEAVARVLRLKFRLGLFEAPAADAAKADALVRLESTKSLARKAAAESIVLLKNRDGILPLTKSSCGTIAVIGPHADDTRLGSYSGEPLYRVSLLDGIRTALGDPSRVLHAKGCSITTNETASPMKAWKEVNLQKYPDAEQDRRDIAAAVETARRADTVLLVLGENELVCREAWGPDHFGDRASLGLLGAQQRLADSILALGKPTLVYLMNGRPLAIPGIVDKADAVLEGWYAGQETGNAAADILFGTVNPSGKLTITIPRSVGQLPLAYDHKPSSRGYPYLDESHEPLFPFGFGLSYTTFSYANPVVEPARIRPDGGAVARVTVANTGRRAGDEIVQMYVHDRIASVTRPLRQLKGFQRITLAPGESRVVSFRVSPDMLALIDADLERVVEPGEFEILIGGHPNHLVKAELTVE
jgi:beta-glucosidase